MIVIESWNLIALVNQSNGESFQCESNSKSVRKTVDSLAFSKQGRKRHLPEFSNFYAWVVLS